MTDNARHPDPDAFDLLGVQPGFALDAAEVRRRRVRALSALQVGDPAVDAAPERFNAAQATLLDPFTRAELLLVRLQAPEVDGRLLPDGFLLEMMELREEADAADAVGRSRLRAAALERRRIALDAIGRTFADALAIGTIPIEGAEDIRRGLNAVRSFDRMIEQLDREDAGAIGP